MNKLHVIGGTPRSGSTLLCNILNENPRFFSSDTSCLPQVLYAIGMMWGRSPEIISDLVNDKAGTDEDMDSAIRAYVYGWYKRRSKERSVVFDKSRFWNQNYLLLRKHFPETHMFLCVHNLLDVVASMEKHHRKSPMISNVKSHDLHTIKDRVEFLLSDEGTLIPTIEGVEDALRQRDLPGGKDRIHIIRCEDFIREPRKTLDYIYSAIGEESFDHDLDNVKNVAGDVDALTFFKFPHAGSGKVEPQGSDWREYIPPDIANMVMKRFPVYNEALGYTVAN